MIFRARSRLYKHAACGLLNLRIRHVEQHGADDGSHKDIVQDLQIWSVFEDVHGRFLSQQRGALNKLTTCRMPEKFPLGARRRLCIFNSLLGRGASTKEKQPQQEDYRQGNAEQPEKYAASHGNTPFLGIGRISPRQRPFDLYQPSKILTRRYSLVMAGQRRRGKRRRRLDPAIQSLDWESGCPAQGWA